MMKRLICLIMAMLTLGLAAAGAEAGARSTELTFADGRLNAESILVSGVVFKYKRSATSDSSAVVRGTPKAAEIAAACASGGSYAINYKISCVRPYAQIHAYDGEIVFVAPDDSELTYQTPIEFSTAINYCWYDYIGAEFFQRYYDAYGAILGGDYHVLLYLDGMLANDLVLTID